ncbi:MAG: ABC-F family ATP-binding cassette domain-containing protein [Spirochaetaceae bacterium]|nr:ABC-F family ATP-binding cassette domain-containing protein [Spirochaetaceae bacterium]
MLKLTVAFIQLTNASISFGEREILKNVSVRLKSGSKSALCGANGMGKSTLLKVIAGEIQCDYGSVSIEKGCTTAYLPQSGIVCSGNTLFNEADSVFEPLRVMLERTVKIREELGGKDAKTEALLAEHSVLFEKIEESGYLRREKEIYQVLTGLGFKEKDMERRCEEFSGGWQMRIALAKVLLKKPDVLILDEPTNYIDIEARIWLLKWLKAFPGALLIVSHDRYFLDSLVTEVFELFAGNIKRYTGNYSEYEKTRNREIESLISRYNAQRLEIEKLTGLIERFKYKASKAAFAQEQIKKLEKMERLELPEHLKKITVKFQPPPHTGAFAFILKDLSKSYGEKQVIAPFDLYVESGEKLVCVGPNGAGKSTLLRILAGKDEKHGGKVRFGAGVCAGYFSQDAAERLCGSRSILEHLEERAPQETRSRLRDALGAFLFRGDDVQKPLEVLSGGEKSRLALLELLMQPVNLLILDEPTNHLDVYSKDALLEALRPWKGACVFVSHDRSFMEALSTKTLELSAGKAPRLFPGNYRYYLEKKEWEESEAGGAKSRETNEAPPPAIKESATAAARKEKKQEQAKNRRRERELEAVFAKIEELEAEKKLLEAELCKHEVYSSGEKAAAVKERLDAVKKETAEKEAVWEALQSPV